MIKLLLKYSMSAPGTFWDRVNRHYDIVLNKLKEEYGKDLHITKAKKEDDLFAVPIHDIYYNLWAGDRLFVMKNRNRIKFLISGSGSSHPKETMRLMNPEIKLLHENPNLFRGVRVDLNTYGKLYTFPMMKDEIILYDNVDYIYVPGKYTAKTYIENKILANKLFILTYSADPEVFKRSQPRNDKFTIFFAGGDKLRKAERFVIPALEQLEFEYQNKFEYQYINGYNPSMYEQIYNASHVALLPTFEDGLPVTLLECAGYEIPFIASYNMSFSEFFDLKKFDENINAAYLEDEFVGLFIDSNKKENLTKNIKKSIEFFKENQEKIPEWGRNFRRFITDIITWDQWEITLYNFFKDKIERCKE